MVKICTDRLTRIFKMLKEDDNVLKMVEDAFNLYFQNEVNYEKQEF